MSVEKMSVSFDLELGGAIRAAAAGAGQSVSAWLADAAWEQLRLSALDDAISAWEQEFGALTGAEMAGAADVLDGAAARRRRGAA